ncbi:MAG: hypothetical protein ACRD8O_07415 [Bryobacteraceae bacterium]
MNSLKHGLTAETLLVDGDNPDELSGFIAMVVDYFQPQNDFETELVLDLAALRWRLRRAAHIETGLFDNKQKFIERVDESYADDPNQMRLGRLYLGIDKSLDLLSRYETRLQRRYNQALANLLKLRAAKPQSAAPQIASQKITRNEPNPEIGHQDYSKTSLDNIHETREAATGALPPRRIIRTP